MKKTLVLLALLLCARLLPVSAQDNPYSIDNDCYTYFLAAENTVNDLSTTEFEDNNEKLLQTAVAKEDQKARTLYYVERLKRTSRLGQAAPMHERKKWNDFIDIHRLELQAVSKETGFTQYYYYAYELAQTYYFNTRQQITAMGLLNTMMTEARNTEDEYGQWQSLRYIAMLYQRQSDIINSRYYLRQVVEMHEASTDEKIRRQSITRQYCDLADTYATGSDSARLYYRKAAKDACLQLDTLRVRYYQAQLAAFDGDLVGYQKNRDFCLAQKHFPQIIRTGDVLFDCVDCLLAGKPLSTYQPKLDAVYLNQQLQYLIQLAESRKAWEVAAHMSDRYISRLQSDLSLGNSQKLEEVSAQMDNFRLNADLARQSQKITRITLLLAILMTIILVGALFFTWLHVRSLRRHQIKDEARIAELQDANEKVRLADAAKTRFVQNMSHEVRTPLNAIVGFSQLLSLPDGSFAPDEKDEFAGHIINNTKMLTMLLDDILNASAMDSGNYSINYEDGECNFMAQAAISSSEHRLQPGVTMQYIPLPEPFTFRTDPRRVQQILINLLTNACKHTTQGSITLACSLTENPGEVTFSVTDTGPGVPPEQAEAIFDRFTKLNEFVQGTGLGLSICRDIAGRMGGRVFLDTSYPGPGARFVFAVKINSEEN